MTDQTQTIEPPLQELSRIDAPLDRRRIGDMAVDQFAGLKFEEYRQAIEFSKLICQARNGIPQYLRGNGGDCLVITTQSLRWKLEPVWVMQHSYVAKAESLIAYDAAVHAAIVLASGKLKGRPRYTYSGEGEERQCTVSATFIGETEPHEYITPPLKQCRPPKNQDGVVKGSPLWTRDVDQQLGYFAIRNWGRRHMPEVLGGVYDRDEFEETSQEDTPVMPPSPNLMSRLPGKMEGAGFQVDVVDQGLAKRMKEIKEAVEEKPPKATEATSTAQPTPAPAPAAPTRHPETAADYVIYAKDWIARATNPDDAEARWDGEREMRAALKVTTAMRKPIDGLLVTKVAALRKGSK